MPHASLQGARGLKSQVASGTSYLLAQSLLVKCVNFLGQIALAWMLTPGSFGVAGLGLTILAFADLVQRSGLKDVIIHRQRRIHLWIPPSLTMNGAVSIAVALGLALSAGAIARWTAKPELQVILRLLSLTIPLNAVVAVVSAVLETKLRFRFIAGVGALSATAQTTLSIALAYRGWGATALIAPIPAVQALRLALYWRASGLVWPRRLAVGRWKYLLEDTAATTGAYSLTAVVWQGDYLLLGLLQGAESLGYYYFAFNLSLQFVLLLTGNLGSALFPALAGLSREPRRQLRAYLTAARLVAFVGMPLCVMQAAVARPAMFALFGSRWAGAVAILQVLSIGMAVRVVEWTSESLLKAQGRFRMLLVLTAVHAALFVPSVALAARFGDGLTVAAVVSALLVMFGPIRMYAAVRTLGGGWSDIASLWFVPVLGSAAGAVMACCVARAASFQSRPQAALLTTASVATFAATYLALTYRHRPAELVDLDMRRMLRRLGGRHHDRGVR